MITYKRCNEVEEELIYEGFSLGFSDYIIKFNMPKEVFFNHFFGPEGNSKEYSFIALDDNKPIGVIFGGIKVYEGIQTIRCGTLAVIPEYRGKGVSHELFNLHKNEGINNNCTQLFLEVITENHRAVRFYESLGYEKVYDLSYYNIDNFKVDNNILLQGIEVKRITFEEFEKAIGNIRYFHVNWQNDIDYMRKSSNITYYGAYIGEKIIGFSAIKSNGSIMVLMVDTKFRGMKVGTSILNNASQDLSISKFRASFSNNNLLEGFYKHLGFKKEKLSQYEMYLTL